MFSFPAQLESDQQTRNWYQDLLDHPDCQNSAEKVQQAYESYRQASLTRSITSLTQVGGESAKPKITPSPALVQYLSHVAAASTPGDVQDHYQDESVNCMVIWARPSQKILDLLLGLQNKLKAVVGTDMWFPESSRLHLSVVEISHRHPMPHLQSVYDQMGQQLIQEILDHPATLAANHFRTARLGRPMLLFDSVGVAIAFVPVGADPYTYHHLRRDLHSMALRSGIKTDTCYTACMGHITLGRFVGTKTFDSEGEETAQRRLKIWMDTIQSMNDELKAHYSTDEWEWTVGEEKGLELQMGMLKFGRITDAAEVVGRSFGSEAVRVSGIVN